MKKSVKGQLQHTASLLRVLTGFSGEIPQNPKTKPSKRPETAPLAHTFGGVAGLPGQDLELTIWGGGECKQHCLGLQGWSSNSSDQEHI